MLYAGLPVVSHINSQMTHDGSAASKLAQPHLAGHTLDPTLGVWKMARASQPLCEISEHTQHLAVEGFVFPEHQEHPHTAEKPYRNQWPLTSGASHWLFNSTSLRSYSGT